MNKYLPDMDNVKKAQLIQQTNHKIVTNWQGASNSHNQPNSRHSSKIMS